MKKTIWSNMDLNADDWRDGYAEYCEINEIEQGDEYGLYRWMEGTNAQYLEDGREIRATVCHHDGRNYYQFRAIRQGRNIEKLLDAIYNGDYISPQKLNYYTRSIFPDVARVYGWTEART